MRTIIKAFFSFTAISLLSLSAFYETSAARETEISEARGLVRLYTGEEKQARDEALRDAKKKAIEQGVGAVLASETEVENFQVVSDRILTKSKGAIKNYKILREGAVDNGVNYEVVISAVVDDDLLNQSMESFRIMQQLTGRKTVMVIYNPTVQGELPLNPENGNDFQLIKEGLTVLSKAFLKRKFEVIDAEASLAMIKDTEAMSENNEGDFNDVVSEMANKYGAQYYVTFTVMASNKEGEKRSETKAIIDAKLFNVGSARLINQISGKGKKKYRKSTSGMDVFLNMRIAINKASKQVRNKLVDSLVVRLYEYAEDGAPLMLRVETDKQKRNNPFKRMLKKMKGVTGIDVKSSSPNEMFIHVYYKGTEIDELFMDLDERFYSDKRNFKGLELRQSQAGDVFVLTMVDEED
jgi:hypothetical protein